MSRGPRSAPPDLPGFTSDRWIGGGGFADVFLYTQLRPSRSVAVKILRSEHLSAQALTQFDAEADIMAEVSTHPYIVTIFASGVSPDGRPYIVMEHYPQQNFGERARGGALDLSEVLRTGIQVASAVETAHRAGIIHRDIKPANILTSTFGRPGLTDFGISGVQSEGVVSEAIGITVAYTAPELLNEETTGSVSTDIYGLGATISALAAGHSPFWSPSGDNGDQAVLARALAGQIAPIARPDVPNSLNHLLTQTMHPNPANRPSSAVALAQSLQEIEQELRLQPTPIEVAQSPGGGASTGKRTSDADDKDRTRRSIQVVNPHATPTDTAAKAAPADVPIIAASAPTASPAPSSRTPFIAPTTPSTPAPATPVTRVPSSMPSAAGFDDEPTRARAKPAPITHAPATPPPARVPVVSRTATPPTDFDDDAETVARTRGTRAPFAPGHAPAPTATSAPQSLVPETPVDAPASPDDAPAAMPPATSKVRKPLPWKPIGAVAALVIAIVVVALLVSHPSRNAKNGPGNQPSTNAGPIQPIVNGDANDGATTPTDLKLSAFTTEPNGNVSANLSWTPGKDKAVNLSVEVVPAHGDPSTGTTVTTAASDTMGKLSVTLTHQGAACTGVQVGDQHLPDRYCTSGPPCFQVTATKQNAASGDPMVVQLNPGDGKVDASTAMSPATYNQACIETFSGGN